MRKPVILVIIAVIAAMLAASTCGGKQPATRSGGQPDGLVNQPDGLVNLPTADSALADLDAMPCPEGVDGALWAELKGALESALQTQLTESRPGSPARLLDTSEDSGAKAPRTGDGENHGRVARATRIVSAPPTGEANRVDDLSIADNGDGTYTLTWHYRNLGDYDQDGKVGISDITPLAQHFGEEVPAGDLTTRNSLQAVIDGSGNGKVGIEDVTAIAQCFNVDCAGYRIEGWESVGGWGEVDSLQLAQPAGVHIDMTYDMAALGHDFYRVIPYDADGSQGPRSVMAPASGPQPPNIVSVSPTNGTAGESLTIVATVEGSEPLSYSWDFSGGASPNVSANASPTVTLGNTGNYSAELAVTNALGSDVLSFILTVKHPGTPPVVHSVTPLAGTSGYEVTFLAEVSGDEPISYSWNFDGGASPNTSASAEPRVVLGSAGSYSARLTLSNVAGNVQFPFTLAVGVYDGGNGGLSDSPWPKFRRDAQNTGRSRYVASQTGSLKWSMGTDNEIWTSPSIGVDGTIYLASEDGFLRAISPEGVEMWRHRLGGEDFEYSSCPTIALDGTIYVGFREYSVDVSAYSGFLDAVNPDGTLKWRYPAGSGSSPTIAEDGTVYFGSFDSYLYAVNPDGTLRWRFATFCDVDSSPAIGYDGTVYTSCGGWGGNEDGYLYAINPDGTLQWEYTIGGSWNRSSPAIDANGTVYLGTEHWSSPQGDSYLYAFNPDGSLKWRYAFEGSVVSSPGIGNSGVIYVGSRDGFFYALLPDGSLKWSYRTDGWVDSSPAVDADENVCFLSGDGYVYSIGMGAALNWQHFTSEWGTSSSPAIGADGTVYVGSSDFHLYAFGD